MTNISTEDYIKAVYKIEERGEKATTSQLALQLDVADASITDMIKKLSEKGLLHYEKYQGVELTAKGRKMALGILRRHRLWEMFLMQFLGYSWDKVHEEAERLEHVTSEELEGRLDKALGYPIVDPHGDPIPGKDGTMSGTESSALTECEVGEVVRVSRVSDTNSELLQHATQIGVGLNSKLTIREKKAFDGSMVVKVGSKQQFISQQVAEAIFVERM
ncbi:MAG: metal-dependent transcriptional regulator [Ignavibacteriae bacterium]|nr:metal-dependent transcriptional regulator [Ignavibacteriota bacterium]